MSRKSKILIFIVAYNAENHIESVLSRIPAEIWESEKYTVEILIIDDASNDNTSRVSNEFKKLHNKSNMHILHNPVNQGYGGNQKLGYHYAVINDFDLVVLLHGDGQYAPELLPDMVNPILKGEADIVLGSRMLKKWDAVKGGMPLYKFIGNQILTKLQNCILGSNLAEFHTGYRAYKVETLRGIPFEHNSNDFDFDTDILIQVISRHCRMKEIPVPTFYGDEICHVNGLKYAFKIIKSTILSRIQKLNIYYHPKFDYEEDNTTYTAKLGFSSSHKFAVDHVDAKSVVADIGCGPGYVAAALIEKGCVIHGYDQFKPNEITKKFKSYHQIDCDHIEKSFNFKGKNLDYLLLLDIIEHLKDPEDFLLALREKISNFNPKIIITTANIAFFITRMSLLFGQFNYGKKGILDITHKRLFTFKQLKRSLINNGYSIKRTTGIPIPFPLVFGNNVFSNCLLLINTFLIMIWKELFSYQIAIIVTPNPTLDSLLKQAETECEKN